MWVGSGRSLGGRVIQAAARLNRDCCWARSGSCLAEDTILCFTRIVREDIKGQGFALEVACWEVRMSGCEKMTKKLREKDLMGCRMPGQLRHDH